MRGKERKNLLAQYSPSSKVALMDTEVVALKSEESPEDQWLDNDGDISTQKDGDSHDERNVQESH